MSSIPVIPALPMPMPMQSPSDIQPFVNRPSSLWMPGIRLMRGIQFASKALIISLVFAIPISVLGWFYFNAKIESIGFSAKERLGVVYARDVLALMKVAQVNRMLSLEAARSGSAPAELAAVREQVQSAASKLGMTQKSLGDSLDTGKQFAVAQQAANALSQANGVDGTFAAHNLYIESLLDLLAQSTDGSNLTLDPDIDTYYLMDAALSRLPIIIESSGKLRGLGAAAIAAASLTPPQRATLADMSPVAEFSVVQMNGGLAKAVAYNPAIKGTIKSEQAMADSAGFFKLVRNDLFGDAVTGDRNAYVKAANQAIEGQYALAERLLTELDRLVDVRISAMVWERNLALVSIGIALALAGYLFYTFFLVTRGGLKQISIHLQAMTSGDLSAHVPVPWGKDEIANSMHDMRAMQTSLRTMVTVVRDSSDGIRNSSSEIAAASMDLSARTENAAASLEESASAIEQVASTVAHTADNAHEVAVLATENAAVAQRAGEVVGNVVSTMLDIQGSSKKIGDIIGTIDGIAFQTNILALNAAVEAARAGEQGRGFAVVASEVRALAQRSAEAAREIKTLISASVETVENGTRIVKGAGETIHELVLKAESMKSLLSEISTASREQSSGVEQVGSTVQELDRSTQQNAALVEETAAAAAALAEQAESLALEVARFKLP